MKNLISIQEVGEIMGKKLEQENEEEYDRLVQENLKKARLILKHFEKSFREYAGVLTWKKTPLEYFTRDELERIFAYIVWEEGANNGR